MRAALILGLCLSTWSAQAHIPMTHDYTWAEEDLPVSVLERPLRTDPESPQRLEALRSVMRANNVDAYIVPTADAHNSQYIADSDARREWLSGLSGSSGTAVVTQDYALVWTDGRYVTQFYMQVNTTYWGLMLMGSDLSINQWLASNLTQQQVVALDPTTYTRTAWNTLNADLSAVHITLRYESFNLVDRAREMLADSPPPRPNNALFPLTVAFTGQRSDAKLAELRRQMAERQATLLVLTALDDIAYVLNLRGTDIPYNPVFFSYLIIRSDVPAPSNTEFFWGNGVLADNVTSHLASEGVTLQPYPYANIFEHLTSLSMTLPEGTRAWFSEDASHAIFSAAETGQRLNIISSLSPVQLMKCVKNTVELEGFRSAHIKDGTAVVRFLRWVHERVDAGDNVTEIHVVDKLDELRGEEQYYAGPSFATIAGTGANGAVIHYKPDPEAEHYVIQPDHMLLVDSGGQYWDGTTDITRTRHMRSSPTEAQRRAFTRVLKGQILMGTALFPRGSSGHVLETLARKALWDVGLNYAHGTGHGVGHFLNVHEGPSGILANRMVNEPGIVPQMIFSNEPGYYEVGEYGIRHEDLVETIAVTPGADHMLADGMVGDFLGAGGIGFKILSLAPHQTACLDINLLTDFEIKYINDYHALVLDTIGPILQDRGLNEDYAWLERECAPIQRSGAILILATPLLTLLSVISLWMA